jgi:hypothetical protein
MPRGDTRDVAGPIPSPAEGEVEAEMVGALAGRRMIHINARAAGSAHIAVLGVGGPAAMTEVDLDYFVRRMSEERDAAARTSDLRAARAHSELAERYAGVIDAYRPLLRQASGG